MKKIALCDALHHKLLACRKCIRFSSELNVISMPKMCTKWTKPSSSKKHEDNALTMWESIECKQQQQQWWWRRRQEKKNKMLERGSRSPNRWLCNMRGFPFRLRQNEGISRISKISITCIIFQYFLIFHNVIYRRRCTPFHSFYVVMRGMACAESTRESVHHIIFGLVSSMPFHA